MYHRHQSCKVQVSISAHDYDECFHGNKTAHTHTRYYRFPKSKRHLCCCSVFFVFCFLLGFGSFVPSSTDFSMCVVFFFFFAVLLLPPILYLLHYFRLFFFCRQHFVCAMAMAFLRYTRVLDTSSMLMTTTVHVDEGRAEHQQHRKSRGGTRRKNERNIFAMA